MTRSSAATAAIATASILLLTACAGGDSGSDGGAMEVPGVDMEAQVVRIGLLNDLSGPAASIGRAVQVGFKVFYESVNAGGSGHLPEGWTIEYVTRDHGYNPQQSVQLFNEIHDDVLFLGMSFGTPTTLPIQPMLQRDDMLAMPISLSSRTGQNRYTPIATPTYRTEAMRAVDWALDKDGADVKLGIVYQQDDFGQDGLEGLEVQAEARGVEIVSKQAIAPGQADFTAVVSALQSAGADHVVLPILPSATGPLLGTATQLGYEPVWIGNTPAWIDQFFDPGVIPAEVFSNFYVATGVPFWGEDRPGMPAFLDAYERFGRSEMDPDWYILLGYMIAGLGVEIFDRALEAGDVSRPGLMNAVGTIDNWDINGLLTPVTASLSEFPYTGAMETRILRPRLAERTWEVVADYQAPMGSGAGG